MCGLPLSHLDRYDSNFRAPANSWYVKWRSLSQDFWIPEAELRWPQYCKPLLELFLLWDHFCVFVSIQIQSYLSQDPGPRDTKSRLCGTPGHIQWEPCLRHHSQIEITTIVWHNSHIKITRCSIEGWHVLQRPQDLRPQYWTYHKLPS